MISPQCPCVHDGVTEAELSMASSTREASGGRITMSTTGAERRPQLSHTGSDDNEQEMTMSAGLRTRAVSRGLFARNTGVAAAF
jgi:hypothetical protein